MATQRERNRAKAAALAAGGGAAVMDAPPGINQPQPFATYFDPYGREVGPLAADARSVEHYRTRAGVPLTLTRPRRVKKAPPAVAVGTLDDWDWSMANKAKETAQPFATTTYYTKDGVAIEGLLADPESMLRYINEIGLSLTPPLFAKEAS